VDKLLTSMNSVFEHLAEIQPFLTETRNMLKEVVARVEDSWVEQDSSEHRVQNQTTLSAPLTASPSATLRERMAG